MKRQVTALARRVRETMATLEKRAGRAGQRDALRKSDVCCANYSNCENEFHGSAQIGAGRGGGAGCSSLYRARNCRRQTGLTVGTVMERSHTPLSTWFWAAYLVSQMITGASGLAASLTRSNAIIYKLVTYRCFSRHPGGPSAGENIVAGSLGFQFLEDRERAIG